MPRHLVMSLTMVLGMGVLTTGCATMVNGRHQTLSVDSYPSGAAVEVDCGPETKVATTPAEMRVSRAAAHCQLTFTREGYEPRVIELDRQASRATKLNAAFGLPSAVILGIAGAITGSLIDETEAGVLMAGEAGFRLGSGAATALDKKGGGWEWTPGKVFVVLSRPEASESPSESTNDR